MSYWFLSQGLNVTSPKQQTPGAMVFAATVALTACHTAPPAPPPTPPQQVEAGSTFTLLTPLTFPSARAELYFQGQRQVTRDALGQTEPYCKLTPQTGAPLSLSPGPMKVRSVTYDERELGDTSAMFGITRIALLATPNQPGYTMSCGFPQATSTPVFVSTEQIYNAIAGRFTMQLLR